MFDVAAEAYGRFMGRYSRPLAPVFADLAEVESGHHVLDVGCGTGALTEVLVDRLGVDYVCAVDPSEPFVESMRREFPGVDVRRGRAESLPFAAACFDRTLAQLVVHFMADPVAGLAEMARVTRPGGLVAATVWDHGGDRGPLATFWRAARELDPTVDSEAGRPGVSDGSLVALFDAAGMEGAVAGAVAIRVDHPSFDDWWEPYPLGAGPAGAYAAGLDADQKARLRERCRALLPPAPFTLEAWAWTVCWPKPVG